MGDSPKDAYLEPYRRAAEEMGAGFDATLWKNREWQRIRFDVIVEMVNLTDRVAVDAGCGAGDFAAYLIEHGVTFREYIGIDGVGPQIEEARRRGLKRSRFEIGDFVHDASVFATARPDLVVFSGSLNTMDEPTVKETLEHAWAAVGEALVFNFLSDRASAASLARGTHPAVRLNTLAMLDWALKRTPLVRFRQDYLGGHDATICMTRPED